MPRKKKTTEEFVADARAVHGDRYDYSCVEYVGNNTKVEILCAEHGLFWQIPKDHLNGKGCPLCGGNKRGNTKSFIEKSKYTHGDRYDYSNVVYHNNSTKVEIVCPEHGSFWQSPASHSRGNGCPECGGSKKKHTNSFIENASYTHEGRYDYSCVEYKNARTKVEIVCPEHGSFWQSPVNHLRGDGCPECGGSKKGNTESFIESAKETHGDCYDYSQVEYINNRTKVEIICLAHGSFWQTPGHHLSGQGCMECSGKKKSNTESFIGNAKEIHGDRYDYSNVKYVRNNTKVEIVCPEHGSFWQTPANHLSGQGCMECSGKKKSNTESFIGNAKEIHGDRYDYSCVEYINSDTKVEVICPEHGSFWQAPYNHLSGRGCPSCSTRKSNPETEVLNLITGITNTPDQIQSRVRGLFDTQHEIDIYAPEQEVAIEFNGIYWHSTMKKDDEQYHYKKSKMCQDRNITLIHIYEDDWADKPELVSDYLRMQFDPNSLPSHIDDRTIKIETNNHAHVEQNRLSVPYGSYNRVYQVLDQNDGVWATVSAYEDTESITIMDVLTVGAVVEATDILLTDVGNMGTSDGKDILIANSLDYPVDRLMAPMYKKIDDGMYVSNGPDARTVNNKDYQVHGAGFEFYRFFA